MEVLFSVMILGIGMIMVAAMFPAAIRQTQANVEDSTSASVAELGDQTMQLMADSKMPPNATPPTTTQSDTLDEYTNSNAQALGTPIIYSFHDSRLFQSGQTTGQTAWSNVSANMVSPNDPQYAWVPMFSRAYVATAYPASPYPNLARSFQLYLVSARCRNRPSGYLSNPNAAVPNSTPPNEISDISVDANGDPSNLDPALIVISATAAAGSLPAYLQLQGVAYGPPSATPTQFAAYADAGGSGPTVLDSNPQYNPLATGAYVIISNCTTTPSLNGTVFKIGTQVQSPTVQASTGTPGVGTNGEYWSIAPDPNASSGMTIPNGTLALVVGRGPDTSSAAFSTWCQSPQATPMPRAGVAQDIGIYTTVIALP